MGQFKPMVKMMTTEPTVELKLKKGGAVAMKKGGSTTTAKKMAMGGVPPMMGAMRSAAAADEGMAPARPSMASRRSSMGRMADMEAKKRVNQMARMAAMGKKEGGETSSMHKAEMKKMSGTAAELKEHKSMSASKAHKGLATGGVALGQGGFKKGGKAMKYAAGGIIKSTTGETKMVTATPDHSPAKTGGVKLGNGGGYKTGGVAKSNAGGYMKGGATKKFARGGSVNDSGKAEAMPQGHKKPSAPVSINALSGTFKKGGKVTPAEAKLIAANKSENASAMKSAKAVKLDQYSKYQKPVKKMANGGGSTSDKERAAYNKFYEDERAENESTRKGAMEALMSPIETMKNLPGKIMKGFNAVRKGMSGEGSITEGEREKYTTVTPAKKRGGAC